MNSVPDSDNVPNANNTQEISDNDRLMAALSYVIPIVAIVVLLSESMKVRPFQKYHAVQALAVTVALIVGEIALCILGSLAAVVTAGIGGLCFICLPVLWLITIWPAVEAYQGKYMEIPVITDFIRNQGWV